MLTLKVDLPTIYIMYVVVVRAVGVGTVRTASDIFSLDSTGKVLSIQLVLIR